MKNKKMISRISDEVKKYLAVLLIIAVVMPLSSCSGTAPDYSTGSVDVDLTTLSTTMVYSEVSNMMTTPEDYKDKIVKMNGIFAVYHDDSTGKDYCACIVQDATACCSQGIEFTLAGKKYPDDYPEIGSEITVIGRFGTYDENGNTYCTLNDSTLV